jgi:hypothetical protein
MPDAAPTAARANNKLAVNRDAIKALAAIHGLREAARLAGLNEDTVCTWAHREKWKIDIRAGKSINSESKPKATPLRSLADRVQASLARRKVSSKVNLSRYVQNASSAISRVKGNKAIHLSKHANNIASTYEKVWPEDRDRSQSAVVNVQILNASVEP